MTGRRIISNGNRMLYPMGWAQIIPLDNQAIITNLANDALEEIDGKIWLHTGDLAEIDDDGYVKIVGRAKEIIVLRTGKKVAPNLVEPIYEEHPYILPSFGYQ